jgi:hypothetical protein
VPNNESKTDILADLAKSLARPVARGVFPITHAQATIAATAARTIPGGAVADVIPIANHILQINVNNRQAKMETVSGAIKRVVRPLIEMNLPKNRLLAEAHDVNAGAGTPLTEQEVEKVVKVAVYWWLKRSQNNAR